MKLKIEIDSDKLTQYTSREEDAMLADELIENASDAALVEEVVSRDIAEDVLDRLTKQKREELFKLYQD